MCTCTYTYTNLMSYIPTDFMKSKLPFSLLLMHLVLDDKFFVVLPTCIHDMQVQGPFTVSGIKNCLFWLV
jgi:hypothetical protein